MTSECFISLSLSLVSNTDRFGCDYAIEIARRDNVHQLMKKDRAVVRLVVFCFLWVPKKETHSLSLFNRSLICCEQTPRRNMFQWTRSPVRHCFFFVALFSLFFFRFPFDLCVLFSVAAAPAHLCHVAGKHQFTLLQLVSVRCR